MTSREPSLFLRLTGLMTALLGAGAALLMAMAWYSARQAADEAYDRLLQGAAFQIADAISIQGGRAEIELPVSAFELLSLSARDRIFYRVIDPGGQTITGYEDLEDGFADGGNDEHVRNGSFRGEVIRVAQVSRTFDDPQLRGDAVIIVAQTVEARAALARELTLRSLFLVGAMSFIAIGGMILAVRRALAPIGRLEKTIRQRGPHDFTKIETPTPRELVPFVTEINNFVERLHGRIEMMQRFIANAAHQLRTPITALDGQVELLKTDDISPAGRQHLERIRERAHQLARLASQLLSHAMVSHRDEAIAAVEFDVVPVVRHAVDEAVPDTGRDILVSLYLPQAPLPVRGDPVNVAEAIKNIVDNAVRHGAASQIRLSIFDRQEKVVVEVEDDGPGIPEKDWPLVAQRFGLPSSDGTSSGLGLSIAGEVATAHGGGLTFRKGDVGFVVALTFATKRENPR
jgi:two-component system sensor histidine kinase TctE